MSIEFQFFNREKYIDECCWNRLIDTHATIAKEVFLKEPFSTIKHTEMLGWMNFDLFASDDQLEEIETFAKTVRKNYEVVVISGIGGSTQATQAVLNSLTYDGIEVLYIGNSLSTTLMKNTLRKLVDKKVYFINIAKNFETLEPGIGFRLMTDYLKRTTQDYAKHVSVIGTIDSTLHHLAINEGFKFWPFYDQIGGRFSGLSAVTLVPLAICGISIRDYIQGAKDLQHTYTLLDVKKNNSYHYALARYELMNLGKNIEILAHFEPCLLHTAKWCVQLFAESEGKDGKGLFPTRANYSEDLHAIGQYVQEGKRLILETFLKVESIDGQMRIPTTYINDFFNYIEDKSLNEINEIARQATILAHDDANVPCLQISMSELSAFEYGQLFYFFMTACFISAELLEVNPFDQNGVEAYKQYMFGNLRK